METADAGGGQGVSILRVLPDTAMILDIPVQLPDIVRGDLADGLAAQPGLDVILDMMAVAFQGTLPHGGCHQLLQPLVQPLPQGHAAVLGEVHAPVGAHLPVELFRQGFLAPGRHIAEDGVSVFLVAHHDASLPAAILPLADHAVSGRSALSHGLHLLPPADSVLFFILEGVQPVCLQFLCQSPGQFEPGHEAGKGRLFPEQILCIHQPQQLPPLRF